MLRDIPSLLHPGRMQIWPCPRLVLAPLAVARSCCMQSPGRAAIHRQGPPHHCVPVLQCAPVRPCGPARWCMLARYHKPAHHCRHRHNGCCRWEQLAQQQSSLQEPCCVHGRLGHGSHSKLMLQPLSQQHQERMPFLQRSRFYSQLHQCSRHLQQAAGQRGHHHHIVCRDQALSRPSQLLEYTVTDPGCIQGA